MWSLDYAIPSLMILSVIIGHYLSLPRLPIKKNLTFVYLTTVVYLGIALDIIATWADIKYQLFPSWVLYFLNSAYFIFFFAIAYAFFMFTEHICFDFTYNFFTSSLAGIPLYVGVVLILVTPWTHGFYYIDNDGYHSGPQYIFLYVIWALYIIFTFLIIANKNAKNLRKREVQVLITSTIILTLGIIMRYIFPSLLLMIIFILISYISIFLVFENPDNRLENRTYIFNRIAFREYLAEVKPVKGVEALVFCDRAYSEKLELYGAKQTNQGIYLLQTYLHKKFPKHLVFYYGNGRFVMMKRWWQEVDWAMVCIELKQRFMEPWISKDTEIYFSLGMSMIKLENQEMSFETLLRVFEEALFVAETGDEDIIETIDNSRIEKIIRDFEIKRALERAIEKDEVEVFFQPIVEAKTRKMAGVEALARIRDSEGNLISPGLFIPIAERNGKINKMGKQVFKKCCEYSNLPEIKKIGLSFINVNLSPIQFLRRDLSDILNSYIDETGADRDLLHLEITEEALIDEHLIDRQIDSLTSHGFKFVLDDYGKGYSNMSRLRKSPFINVKLDMSLVWDYCNKPGQILPSEIEAFKKSGFEITAEGIETDEIADIMTELGCTYLQGFFFSKPLPINEFIEKYKVD